MYFVGGVDVRQTNDEIRGWQDQFLNIPNPTTCESFFKYYTAKPHYPASAGAKEMVNHKRGTYVFTVAANDR